MIDEKIGGVSFDAPLFRGATLEQLQFIINKLSSASYHYADDTAQEWDLARQCVEEAAKVVNKLSLRFEAIQAVYRHKEQLVPLSQLMNAILKDARK